MYHCQIILPHFSAWSPFPDVAVSVLDPVSPEDIFLCGPSPISLNLQSCCFSLHVIWAAGDYGEPRGQGDSFLALSSCAQSRSRVQQPRRES